MTVSSIRPKVSKIYFIDLFCGAGGVTTGIHHAVANGKTIAEVIACVNHDPLAIQSHEANHPGVLHYIEDIRKLDIANINEKVKQIRLEDANAVIALWASLECTNFSKAKGGLPRDADSRTLAEHLFRYIETLNPDFIWIENVEEFMSWGPLDEKGKPISRKNGSEYLKWVHNVIKYGYEFDYKILNAANYGAYTSRKRYFAQFAKPIFKISWPEATHSKNAVKDSFGELKQWRPVKDCLNFSDEGESIFTRNKEWSEKTLERIYAGLIKFVAGGKENFLLKYNSTSKKGVHIPPSVENPAPVIAAQDRLGLVNCCFLSKYFSGRPEHKNISISGPSGAIKTVDSHALVNCSFLTKYYSSGNNISSVEQTSPTLTTKDRLALIQPLSFIQRDFSGGGQIQSVESPSGSILGVPKLNLVNCEPWIMNTQFNNVGSNIHQPAPVITANRKHHYLMNPQYFNNGGDINKPCFTLIARMDKMPPYLISTENGQLAIEIYVSDSPAMKKIKTFMGLYGLVDIKMRMLRVPELLKIQGFGEKYILKGSQAHQKKFIGNSVPPPMVKALIEAMYKGLAFKETYHNK